MEARLMVLDLVLRQRALRWATATPGTMEVKAPAR